MTPPNPAVVFRLAVLKTNCVFLSSEPFVRASIVRDL